MASTGASRRSMSRLDGNSAARAVVRGLIDSRLGQTVKPSLARMLARFGFELVPLYRNDRQQLARLLRRLSIATVFDIGANQGQFGTLLRRLGYTGSIVSLEPMGAAFKRLEAQARSDPLWSVSNVAAGREVGRVALNVAKNSTSSSLLAVNQLHVNAEPTSRTVRVEMVRCRTLDEVAAEHSLPPPYFLKVDVQGGELDVLDGGRDTLTRTSALRVESSLRELYEGAPTLGLVQHRLEEEGFVPIAVEPAFQDPRTGDTLQVDIVACRRELLDQAE
jgi:FkbM family methyltransferase